LESKLVLKSEADEVKVRESQETSDTQNHHKAPEIKEEISNESNEVESRSEQV